MRFPSNIVSILCIGRNEGPAEPSFSIPITEGASGSDYDRLSNCAFLAVKCDVKYGNKFDIDNLVLNIFLIGW